MLQQNDNTCQHKKIVLDSYNIGRCTECTFEKHYPLWDEIYSSNYAPKADSRTQNGRPSIQVNKEMRKIRDMYRDLLNIAHMPEDE